MHTKPHAKNNTDEYEYRAPIFTHLLYYQHFFFSFILESDFITDEVLLTGEGDDCHDSLL